MQLIDIQAEMTGLEKFNYLNGRLFEDKTHILAYTLI